MIKSINWNTIRVRNLTAAVFTHTKRKTFGRRRNLRKLNFFPNFPCPNLPPAKEFS